VGFGFGIHATVPDVMIATARISVSPVVESEGIIPIDQPAGMSHIPLPALFRLGRITEGAVCVAPLQAKGTHIP
jgi:hypothetical protein